MPAKSPHLQTIMEIHFNRLLIAQAMVELFTPITRDENTLQNRAADRNHSIYLDDSTTSPNRISLLGVQDMLIFPRIQPRYLFQSYIS